MPKVTLIVELETKKPAGIVAHNLEEMMKRAGAQEVMVTIGSAELIMPFGPHKNKPMNEVPSKYLDRIIGEPWIAKWPEVQKYIMDNLESIHADVVTEAG